MIRYEKGDLLTVNDKYIAHGVNCMGTMGAGVALAIRLKYPTVYEEYYKFVMDSAKNGLSKKELLGKVFVSEVDDTRAILNIFSQERIGRNGKFVSYDALDLAFETIADNKQITSLSIPKIGAGLGGGNWEVIEKIIDYRLPDITVTVREL